MKIIMSPAKKMRSDEDASITPTTPCFLNESYILEEKLKSMSYEELRKLWKTNETLTNQCFEELQVRQFKPLTCAMMKEIICIAIYVFCQVYMEF